MAKFAGNCGRLKATEPTGRGSPEDVTGAPLACNPSVGQSRSGKLPSCPKDKSRRGSNAVYVPVVSSIGKPLSPCHPARARELVRKGKAVRRFRKQVFYIQLTEREDGVVQETALGVDPGSKREGFSVLSAEHTYLNIQTEAVTYVKKVVEQRRMMRRARRFRKTPCRKNRQNRAKGGLPPSTKARWQWKLNIAKWLCKLYPIKTFVVEDVKVASWPGKHRWNTDFGPLGAGKKWFYEELEKLGNVVIKQGEETNRMRTDLGLLKNKLKLAQDFHAHCVDSWVLANSWVGGHLTPENKRVFFISQPIFHRRQLHNLQPAKNGVRINYGGTRSLGFKRGSLVIHPKYGLCYVGGTSKGRISVHALSTGKRLTQQVKPKDCELLTFNTWRGGNSSPV